MPYASLGRSAEASGVDALVLGQPANPARAWGQPAAGLDARCRLGGPSGPQRRLDGRVPGLRRHSGGWVSTAARSCAM